MIRLAKLFSNVWRRWMNLDRKVAAVHGIQIIVPNREFSTEPFLRYIAHYPIILQVEKSRPGQLNYYLINEEFYFVDLPGYGYAKVPEQIKTGWRKLVEDYVSTRKNIKIVFELMDSRHDPTYLDQLMINWLEYYEINYAIILTKSDKISANKMERQIYRTSKIVKNDQLCKDYIPFSAFTGEGKNIVLKLIEEGLAS